jgi:hypothetical protein
LRATATFDLYPLDEVSAATGFSVMPVLAARNEIAKLIKKHLGVGSETVDGLVAAAADDEDQVELLSDIETDGSELSEMAQEASVVRLVNEILLRSSCGRATCTSSRRTPAWRFATASMACSRRSPCRRKSTASSRPLSAA